MKLLLRNLCSEVCENELTKLLSSFGSVMAAKVIRDEVSKHSRGVAVVEMENGGEVALTTLNRSNYKGQYLIVTKID